MNSSNEPRCIRCFKSTFQFNLSKKHELGKSIHVFKNEKTISKMTYLPTRYRSGPKNNCKDYAFPVLWLISKSGFLSFLRPKCARTSGSDVICVLSTWSKLSVHLLAFYQARLLMIIITLVFSLVWTHAWELVNHNKWYLWNWVSSKIIIEILWKSVLPSGMFEKYKIRQS